MQQSGRIKPSDETIPNQGGMTAVHRRSGAPLDLGVDPAWL